MIFLKTLNINQMFSNVYLKITKILTYLFAYPNQIITFGFQNFNTVNVGKTLLMNWGNQKRRHYLILLLFLFFIQKSAATIFYVNDLNTKGDIYTTSAGNDSNDGMSAADPKLTLKAAYEIAQDGDTIIVDTGTYSELSEKGKIAFIVTKKITFTIAGIANPAFSKNPIHKEKNNEVSVFYIDKDKPVEREIYLQQKQNEGTKKSQ
jgi:hypothetical protein